MRVLYRSVQAEAFHWLVTSIGHVVPSVVWNEDSFTSVNDLVHGQVVFLLTQLHSASPADEIDELVVVVVDLKPDVAAASRDAHQGYLEVISRPQSFTILLIL